MPFALLADRQVIAVTGAEAHAFLQNLVTADLDTLVDGETRPAALLSPQGKILFEFLVSRIADGLRLDVAASVAESLIKRLALYRLRMKIAIEARDEHVCAVWGETVPGALRDMRFPADVVRLYGETPTGVEDAGAEAFARLRIAAGVAEADADYAAGDVFPHDVLLDQNGGVSFRKGCYIGQEVVSRMQHRGTARRRIMLVTGAGPIAKGAAIFAGGRTVGTVLAATVGEGGASAGFGLLRIDRVAEALATGQALTCDGVDVAAAIPLWAAYRLPDAAEIEADAS